MKTCIVILSALLVLALLVYPTALGARTWYILPDGTGDAPTIQAGVDSSAVGDTVLVACGTYHDCTHQGDWFYDYACVVLKSEITLRSETGLPDCATIDAEQIGRVIVCEDVDSTTVIEGFTITGGYDGGGLEIPDGGGGMICVTSSPRIKNCIFLENQAELLGGGLHSTYNSAPIVSNCNFLNNEGGLGGGVASSDWSYAVFDRCTFKGNMSGAGGAAFCGVDSCLFNECEFIDNITDEYGGAIFVNGTQDCVLRNCVFRNNSSSIGGAIRSDGQSNLYLYNCIVDGNHASTSGGGIVVGLGSYPNYFTADSSVILNNTSPIYPDGRVYSANVATLICCEIDTNQWGGGGTIVVNNDDCGPTSVTEPWSFIGRARLFQNHPNPFNPSTSIKFAVPNFLPVKLTIYGIDGRYVSTLADNAYTPGPHTVIWNGTDDQGRAVASGSYIYRLEAGEYVESKRMLLVR